MHKAILFLWREAAEQGDDIMISVDYLMSLQQTTSGYQL